MKRGVIEVGIGVDVRFEEYDDDNGGEGDGENDNGGEGDGENDNGGEGDGGFFVISDRAVLLSSIVLSMPAGVPFPSHRDVVFFFLVPLALSFLLDLAVSFFACFMQPSSFPLFRYLDRGCHSSKLTILARYLLVPSFTITSLPSLVSFNSLSICFTFTRLINPLSFDSSHSTAISFGLRDISLLKATRITSIRFHTIRI